ncbi:hypothetical protein KA005_42865, partial [bacterium]|nr:hypothetical protein [bacterium]
GMKINTISPYLQAIRDIGLIDYTQKINHGVFGKTNLTMYKWDGFTEEQITYMDKFKENKQTKKKAVIPKTVIPKTALPKTTLYKNNNKLLNDDKNSFSLKKESAHKPRAPKPETSHTNYEEKISENFKPRPAPFPAEVPNIPSNNEISKINPNIPDQSQTSGKSKVTPLSKGDSNLISNSFSINSKNNPEMKFVRFFCEERKKQIPDSQFPKTSEELQKWEKDMQDIINAGHKSETIKEIIRFVFNNDDPFWISRVAKPLHLKNSFETILGQMVKSRRNGKHKNEIDVHRGFLPKGPPEEAFAVI